MVKKNVVISIAMLIAAFCMSVWVIHTHMEKTSFENLEIIQPKLFKEVHETRIFVDEGGNGYGWAELSIPPSELADFMKSFVLTVGTDIIQQEYESIWRSSFSMLGIEIDLIESMVKIEENFTILLNWRSPHVARWDGNKWVIEMAWVDPDSAASEILSGILTSWLTVASIAKEYGYKACVMEMHSTTRIILPEWAENVWCNAFENEEHMEYGRGSYSLGRFTLSQENGRPAIIEEELEVLDSRYLIEIRTENLLENHAPLLITYSGGRPVENFEGFFSRVRIDLKFGRIRDAYLFSGDNVFENLTLGQILYNASLFLLNGENFSPSFIPVTVVGEEVGDWNVVLRELNRENLTLLTGEIVAQAATGSIPASIQTVWGQMRYRDFLYTILRLLRENSDVITFLPVPDGVLFWDNVIVEAKLAYYLLPDSFVLTGTERVREILKNIYDENKRKLAEEICNWTGSNILYSLSFRPPTSEEVIESKRGQCRDYSNVYLAIARTAGLPSRIVNGWVESDWIPPAGWGFGATTTPDGKRVILHAWVQVFIPAVGWLDVEPQSMYPQLYVGVLPYSVYVRSNQSWTEAIASYETARGLI